MISKSQRSGRPRKGSAFTPLELLVAIGLIVIVCSMAASAPAAAAEPRFSYVNLVQRLADLERLATLPAPGEQCAQWSSYDRKSRYDEATGKYVDWDANGDG
ncbi:MAG: hypothetical protein ABSH34_14695, partial [Verrucomicrobiota bacterium]